MLTQKITLIGAGHMGQAIAKGLLQSKTVSKSKLKLTVKRKEHASQLSNSLKHPVSVDSAKEAVKSEVLLLCMKPKVLLAFLDKLDWSKRKSAPPLVISIAAGVSLAALEKRLPKKTPVVRAIPNTPCLIGEGVTAYSLGKHTKPSHGKIADAIFSSLGEVMPIEEKHLDTITGLSASGPAFVYVFIEALADGAVMRGLPRAIATQLTAQTLKGAAAMVLETGRHPADLKDDVTTPAGCTIGALLHMEDRGIRSALARGVEEAARIAASLAQEEN